MSYISQYYSEADPNQLVILEELWRFAQSVEPGAEEGLSYGLPALKLHKRPLIGFSIAKNHMSVYPFSPKIIDDVKNDLTDFETSKGLVRFTRDHVIPKEIIEIMIQLRKLQIES